MSPEYRLQLGVYRCTGRNNRTFDRAGLETRLTLNHLVLDVSASCEFGVSLMQEETYDTRIPAVRSSDRASVNDRHIIDFADSITACAWVLTPECRSGDNQG